MELPAERCVISRAHTAGLLGRSGKTPLATGNGLEKRCELNKFYIHVLRQLLGNG